MTVARNLTICTGLLALAALSGAAVGPAVTGAAVVVGVAGSLACNLAASRIDAAGKSFLGRWTALRQGKALDPNHDEARALRQAQLAALRNLLDEWQAVPGGEFADLRRTAHAALEWARTELKASVKGDATDASAVEAALRDALPLALAEMAGAPRGETAASAAIDLRRLAENAVLAELAAAGHPLEGEAERRFRDPGTGWFARFAVQGAAKIKHDAAARHIWMAMRLALVDERTATIEEFAASNDEQVRAIAAEVNKLSALAARIDDQIFGTPPVLMLLPEVRPMSAADRFSFRNPDIPFRGRGDELAELDAFLDDERPFAWHMLVGGGGAGKSRLALELCKRRDGDWRVGFAPREGNETVAAHTLNAWQPRKSHLIIVDYVLANSAMTTALLTMGVANGGRYGHKLRVLLIERADEDFQRAQLWGAAQERQGIEAARWRSDALNVGEQTDEDIFALAGPFLGGLEIERADFLARHAEVDPERRTLTALILAEAMAAGEGEAATLSALIGRLVARERKRWRAMGIRPAVEEPLLALSTMIDGYEAARDAERLPQPLQNALSDEVGEKGFAALRSEAPPTEAAPGRLGRLLPDLVGEFFALDLLAASVAATGAPRFPWLAEAAWRAGDGWNTAEFAWRARRDFGGHPGLQALRRPVAGVSQSYAFEVFDHVEAAAQSAGEKREAFPEEAFRVLATYDDWAARLAEADLLTAFAGESGWHFSAGRIAGFITALADVATRPAVPVELLVRLASSVFAFVTTRSDGNPEEARALLDRLGAASAVAGAPPEVRVEWAKSVFNYILHTDAAAPEPTQALLERLEAASAVAGAPPELRVLWAKSVTNYILHTAAVAPESARALLDDLQMASAVAGAPPELREEWAKSVFNYIFHTAAAAPESARALLDELEAASAVAGAPPELRVQWVKSVFNYILHTGAVAPESACALLDDLQTASAVAGAPPEVREQWAKSSAAFIAGRCSAKDFNGARAFYATVASRWRERPEPKLWFGWAAAVRFLLEAQREDAADAVLLPDLLSDLLFLADVAADDPRVMDVLAPLDDHIARARENVPRGDGSGPGN